jgi:hypothetical protein
VVQYRAKLDAIRGPPVFIVNKMPDKGSLTMKPEIIRGSIKSRIQIHNLEAIMLCLSQLTYLQLPKGFPRYSWFTLHFSEFYSHLSLFHKYVLHHDCTTTSCPVMRERSEDTLFIWIYDEVDGTPLSSINLKVTYLLPLALMTISAVSPSLPSEVCRCDGTDSRLAEGL